MRRQQLRPLLPARHGGPGRPPRDLALMVFIEAVRADASAAVPQTCMEEGFLEALIRQQRGPTRCAPTPSAGGIDAQSVKAATQGTAIGYDSGKRVKGRKRHLLVDPRLDPECKVTAAHISDADGLKALLRASGRRNEFVGRCRLSRSGTQRMGSQLETYP